MPTYLVTRKSDGQQVYEYQYTEARFLLLSAGQETLNARIIEMRGKEH